eukprot:1219949-Rhodomonas_salina.1
MMYQSSVFEGFTIAVAVIIGAKQINPALGLDTSLMQKHDSFVLIMKESLIHVDTAKLGSIALFVPEVIILFVLMKKLPKIPWMIIVSVATMILGFAMERNEKWDLPTLKSQYGNLKVSLIEFPRTEVLFQIEDYVHFFTVCASVSVVSMLETLISAKIAEFRAVTNLACLDERKELIGLTWAQLVTGLFGGIPPTGVFVRASVNQLNGATHKFSQ